MRSTRVTALLAALLLAPTGASAQGLVARLPGLGPTSFSLTSTTVGRYRGQNFDTNLHDDNFGSLTERLDVSALATPWRLYLRVDGFVPFGHDTTCAPNEAALCYLNWDLRPGGTGRDRSGRGEGDNILDSVLPERLSLRYQRRGLTLELGDFYQVFGRGVALSFRKVDPIGLDTTLRGGRFEYERGRMTLRAFGGYSNPQNLDPISLGTFDDPRDLLVGALAGIDMFDCVLPTRNARNGQALTWTGRVNIKQARNRLDDGPLDPRCDGPCCNGQGGRYTRGYLRHLFLAKEILAARVMSLHNVHFLGALMRAMRGAIAEGRATSFVRETLRAMREGDEVGAPDNG